MQKMSTLFSISVFLFSLILLSSCGGESFTGPVKIAINKRAEKPIKIVIDGKETFNVKSDTTFAWTLSQGKHTVSVDDSTAREFTVGKRGGLLNLDDRDFVVYEIRYTSQDPSAIKGFDINSMIVKSTILIDSFIIVPKGPLSNADSSLRKILPDLQKSKNGTYYAGYKGENEEAFHGLTRIGKGKLFIDKFWDYNLADEIPETLTIQTSKYSVGNVSATRSSIMVADYFLIYAIMNQEEFTVKSIKSIMEGSEDKRKQKELEEKQMDF